MSYLSYLTKLFKVGFDLLVRELSFQLPHIHFALLRLRLLHCHLQILFFSNVYLVLSSNELSTFLPFTVCSSADTASFKPSTVLNTTNANPL